MAPPGSFLGFMLPIGTWTPQLYAEIAFFSTNKTSDLLGRNGKGLIFLNACSRYVPEKLNKSKSFIKGKQDPGTEFFYKLNSNSLIYWLQKCTFLKISLFKLNETFLCVA